MMRNALIGWLMTMSFTCLGQMQDQLLVVPDSLRAFTLGNLYTLILSNHPTAKQAALLSEVAQQEIRLARGSFDPKLEAEVASKQLDGKTYYDMVHGSLKVPTRIPLDPSIGIDRNRGAFLSPEHYISDKYDFKQFYAGVSVPLGRGLITDERRTALRQAELFKDMTEAEQVKIINKLLLDASKQYWDWFYAYHSYRLLNRNVGIAKEIFRRVKTNFDMGEASTIDTVQSAITLQQRTVEQQQAFIDFRNAGLRLGTMLWDSLNNPLDLDLRWIPVLDSDTILLTDTRLKELTDNALTNHPELVKLEVKTQQLEAERRLAQEYLKPQLNLKYHVLNQPITPSGDFAMIDGEDYKFALDFSMPIFLRKERSKLALTRLKISNNLLEQTLTQRQIVNNMAAIYNQVRTLRGMIDNQRSMVDSYERLVEAELLNLEQGESDLFKINIQQEKLIQSQTKWLKMLSEYEKEKAHLYWAAGVNRLTF